MKAKRQPSLSRAKALDKAQPKYRSILVSDLPAAFLHHCLSDYIHSCATHFRNNNVLQKFTFDDFRRLYLGELVLSEIQWRSVERYCKEIANMEG